MPFRAFINGQEVIAFDVTTTQWQVYQKDRTKVVTMSCCQNRGILKTSHKGLQFFAHHPDNPKPLNCLYKGETEQHLKAKMAIRDACLGLAGVTCHVEVSEEGWRADVLANKGDRKIAFEVQWSPQNIVETQLRQERYRQSGVECVWLFRTTPDSSPNPELPIFQLVETGGEFQVEFESRYLSLSDFVKAWLNEQIQYCTHHQSSAYQKINICISSCFCAKCKEKNHYFQILNSIYLSECGLPLERNLSKRSKLEFRPEIVQIIQKFLEQQHQKNLSLSNIEFYYSFSQKIWRFTCCWCGTPINEDSESECIAVLEQTIRFNSPITHQVFPHWCWSKSTRFCNQHIVADEPQQSMIWVEGRKETNFETKKVNSNSFSNSSTTERDLADLPLSIKKSDELLESQKYLTITDSVQGELIFDYIPESVKKVLANLPILESHKSLTVLESQDMPREELKQIWDLIYNSLPPKYEGLFRHYASLKSKKHNTIVINLSHLISSKTLHEYMLVFLKTCQNVFGSKELMVRVELMNNSQILWESTIDLNEMWQQFLNKIPSNHNSLRSLLREHGKLLSIQEHLIIISLSSPPLINRASQDKLLIKQSFQKILKRDIEIEFVLLKK